MEERYWFMGDVGRLFENGIVYILENVTLSAEDRAAAMNFWWTRNRNTIHAKGDVCTGIMVFGYGPSIIVKNVTIMGIVSYLKYITTKKMKNGT